MRAPDAESPAIPSRVHLVGMFAVLLLARAVLSRVDVMGSAEAAWLQHYEDCETCMEGAEAAEFALNGEDQYCGKGMALKAASLVEAGRG